MRILARGAVGRRTRDPEGRVRKCKPYVPPASAFSFRYVAASFAGLRVFDAADATAPVEVGAIDTPDSALDIEVSSEHDWYQPY